MNKIAFLIGAFLILITNLQAQEFEGKITFKLSYGGDAAAQMQAMAPSGIVYQTRDGNTRFEMQGGMAAMMLGTFIVHAKDEAMYVLKDSEKKAYKMPLDGNQGTDTKPKVTKLKETLKIQGYKCQKYKVETTIQGQPMVQHVWAAKDIKMIKPKAKGAAGNLYIEGVEGFPLKIEADSKIMGMSITTTTIATEVDTKKPNKSNFEVPKGYTVEKTTMEALGRGLLGG